VQVLTECSPEEVDVGEITPRANLLFFSEKFRSKKCSDDGMNMRAFHHASHNKVNTQIVIFTGVMKLILMHDTPSSRVPL